MNLANFPHDGTTLGASAWYLGHGVQPVPIPRQNGWKSPVLKDWQKLRPTASGLSGLFSNNPPVNIGLLLGEPSGGLVDVDLDAPEAVAAGNLLLPKTGWISGRAGKPRSHWWYRVDAPPSKASEKYLDVDEQKTCLVELRSTGGQTVAPPSVHFTQERIVWESQGEPATIAVSELRRAVALVAGVALLARHWPGPGSRQDAFLALAGALSQGGVPPAEAERICSALVGVTGDDEGSKRFGALRGTYEKASGGTPLTGWTTLSNLLSGDGPKTVRAILGIWRGVLSKTGGALFRDEKPLNSRETMNCGYSGNCGDTPGIVASVDPWPGDIWNPENLKALADRGITSQVAEAWPEMIAIDAPIPGDPFPTHVLPKKLAEYVRQISRAMNVRDDFAGVTALTVAAGIIGNAARLRITSEHEQPALLFAALVGPPGSAKSPLIERFTKALSERQKRCNAEFASAMAYWNDREDENGEKPEKPSLKSVIGRETTTECLLYMLPSNPRGFPLVFDELSGLFGSMNQYKRTGNDRQIYLSMWSQSTIDQRRKTDLKEGLPPNFVFRPCVSILGGIQPDMLGSFKLQGPRGETFDDGGMDRFLFCSPEPLPELGEQFRSIEPSLTGYWDGIVIELLDTMPEETIVRMSAEAVEEWSKYSSAHAAEVNSETFPRELHGPWKKLKAYACRLALVLHVLDWACGETVSLDTLSGSAMRRGCELADYFKSHRRKVASTSLPEDKLDGVRRISHWLAANKAPRVQKRDIYQRFKGTWKTVESLEPILESALGYHVIRPGDPDLRKSRGRKSSPWFEVHPDLLGKSPASVASHNSHNPRNSTTEGRVGGGTIVAENNETPEILEESFEGPHPEAGSEPVVSEPPVGDPQNCPERSPESPNSDETWFGIDEHIRSTDLPVPEDLEAKLCKLERLATAKARCERHLTAVRNQLDECRKDARLGRVEQARRIAEQLEKTIPECLATWTE